MTQMEYEAFEGLIKYAFIIGAVCWYLYNTRELAFDHVLERKIRPSNDYGYIWKYIWRCVIMLVVVSITYAGTMVMVEHYLSPGQ